MGTFLFSQSTYTASFYNDKYEGRKMANAQTFRQSNLTGASNVYKLGTKVKVTNQKSGKTVIVTITDRLHPKFGHRIDLSKSAFNAIASLKSGVARVTVEKI